MIFMNLRIVMISCLFSDTILQNSTVINPPVAEYYSVKNAAQLYRAPRRHSPADYAKFFRPMGPRAADTMGPRAAETMGPRVAETIRDFLFEFIFFIIYVHDGQIYSLF